MCAWSTRTARRAYVKWLIPLLFVHGVFMLYAVFMLLLAQLRVEARSLS